MTITTQVLSCQEQEQPITYLSENEIAFLSAGTRRDFNSERLDGHPELLNYLVAAITRQPKNLAAHMQRIYFCYRQDLAEQLYGALTDLFVVLNRRSIAFSGRLLNAVRSKLPEEQYKLLRRYLLKKDFPAIYLPQSSFSVLGRGLIGGYHLVSKVNVTPKNRQEHDPLRLARDYIEYSQLQEAKDVLEQAVMEDPERDELHADLLDLYKSLKDTEGFREMFKRLAEEGNPFQGLWEETNAYLNRQQK
jgi:hypothetical protein